MSSAKKLTDEEKIKAATELLISYGSIDGAHHKMWAIDQAVRLLAGKDYKKLIKEYCAGDDGPSTYYWDTGIVP